jgi:FlaA1/EpsC-like NDP-sugar epimerase
MSLLKGSSILVTGGTGSLGGAFVDRLLDDPEHRPRRIIVFSRDEAKQHGMRLRYLGAQTATDEVIYRHSESVLRFAVGDVRDQSSIDRHLGDIDFVVHAAAMKQVPTCEYSPQEAVATNVNGTISLLKAVAKHASVKAVVSLSTDKACHPASVMGMTKAIMERLMVAENLVNERCRYLCVRYGNVIASRGSVLPLFAEQIDRGGPVTITDAEMTRFFITLDQAVGVILEALLTGRPGEILIPKLPSVRIVDLVESMMGAQSVPIAFSGVRPGEKLHEFMVSDEEARRTVVRGALLAIQPMLPEIASEEGSIEEAFGSASVLGDVETIRAMFSAHLSTNRVEL